MSQNIREIQVNSEVCLISLKPSEWIQVGSKGNIACNLVGWPTNMNLVERFEYVQIHMFTKN